jgi:hypothetical protein
MDGMLPVETKGKPRPSYTKSTETSLLKSEKKSPATKFISSTFQGPASASKFHSGQPAFRVSSSQDICGTFRPQKCGWNFHDTFKEGSQKSGWKRTDSLNVGAKASVRENIERTRCRIERNPSEKDSTKGTPLKETTLKSILKKGSPYPKTSPSKTVHIKLGNLRQNHSLWLC